MKTIKYLAFFSLLLITACSTLVLQPANFAWPVESVLDVDDSGMVSIQRYSLSFNTKNLFLKETGDSLGYQNKKIRVIRDTKGYYFMVGNDFKNVYVFKVKDGTFSLANSIQVSDTTRFENPAFNQRPPYVQLLYDNNQKINLTEEGIIKEEGGR